MGLSHDTDTAIWDGSRMAVSFEAFDGAKRVLCRVSIEALEDDYGCAGASEGAAMDSFRANERGIRDIATTKYAKGQVEADGSVLVRSGEARKV